MDGWISCAPFERLLNMEIVEASDGQAILRMPFQTFAAMEWLAAMCSHVPNKGEQMVRYYGYYSNVCRGQRKKTNEDGLVPCILQTEESSKEYRKNWTRLIQKIYEVDPLTCPKCSGKMKIISDRERGDYRKDPSEAGKSSSTLGCGK
jgi:hypothetical protein